MGTKLYDLLNEQTKTLNRHEMTRFREALKETLQTAIVEAAQKAKKRPSGPGEDEPATRMTGEQSVLIEDV